MKRVYKVFNPDWTCRDYDFKNENGEVIGTEHKIEEKPKLCKVGFHYCNELVDCFKYYDFNPNNKVAEIEILGEIDGNKEDKGCSNHIKIIRELTWQEVLNLCNLGKNNTGYRNSGDRNSGYRNSGNWNSGDRNSGDWNSGNWNSGDRNSGNWNSGDWNSGDWNSGDWNSGDWNSGYRNSGNWNSCNFEAGFFNSKESKYIRIFNKKCERNLWKKALKPNFIYFNLTEWIYYGDMTKDEKEKYPEAEFRGGYLKIYEYKEAWKKAWDKAKNKSNWDEEFNKLINLPNFDKKVFKEITGIDIDKD